jgi:hypothetical protein
MRKFAAFILTHGRPDNVITYKKLRESGYSGQIYLIIDNEDATADRYREKFGDEWVIEFDKKAMADRIDEANNFDNRKVIVHARNASFDIAERLGLTHFVQLDDDYNSFLTRSAERGKMCRRLDDVINATLDFLDDSGCDSVAWSQGGDHIGGFSGIQLKRKAMNSFFCRTDRKFQFIGAINEDVNTYTLEGSRGRLFFTFTGVQLNQEQTQKQGGGMTDIYLERGTYVKSFTSVLFCPSSVRVGMMSTRFSRIHHLIDWNATTPKIVPHHIKKENAVA